VVFGWILEVLYEALTSVICFFGKNLSWETLCPRAYYGVAPLVGWIGFGVTLAQLKASVCF
jgi:hypothetical protein